MTTNSDKGASSPSLRWIDDNQQGCLDGLLEYLRIPSVSTDPAFKDDVARCSRFLDDELRRIGLESRIVETAGHPLVVAERMRSPELPTVLFYGHYDVQPPDPLEEWTSPPFEPRVEDGKIFARGATDDKGQSWAHVKAVEAILATADELPVNVRFLVEGEEESGGEAIEHFVRSSADELRSDCVVISDSSMYAPGQPSLLYGLKGLLYMELGVTGPNRDLHSGTYGGALTNPLNALAHIVDALRDPKTGRVLIPGFYDDVRELEAWEREQFAALPFDEKDYCDAIGIPETFGEEGFSTLERVWARPTCDVNGIWGGYQGAGAKTVIAAEGGAKVSMRLVPDQDPERLARAFEQYVRDVAPIGVEVSVIAHSGAQPVRFDVEGPFMDAAQEALQDVWGTTAVKVREGGSIPIVQTFSEVLEVPVLLIGFGLTDDCLHAPNEKFGLENFYQGIRTTVRLLERIGESAGAR